MQTESVNAGATSLIHSIRRPDRPQQQTTTRRNGTKQTSQGNTGTQEQEAKAESYGHCLEASTA